MTYLCNGREENERFRAYKIHGDCLEGLGIHIPQGAFVIVDSNTAPEVGDLVHCNKITGEVGSYIKQVKEVKDNSVIVGTAYLDGGRDFTFEAAEIMGVVKEIYCKISGKRKYVRPKRENRSQMKISQLIQVMDKDDEIIIHDDDEPMDRNLVYQGTVGGINRNDSIERMHVVVIFPDDDKLMVIAKKPTGKDGASE